MKHVEEKAWAFLLWGYSSHFQKVFFSNGMKDSLVVGSFLAFGTSPLHHAALSPFHTKSVF